MFISRTAHEMIYLHFQGLVPTTVFKERLDFDTLENVGLISSRQQYQGKYVKTKTRLL